MLSNETKHTSALWLLSFMSIKPIPEKKSILQYFVTWQTAHNFQLEANNSEQVSILLGNAVVH